MKQIERQGHLLVPIVDLGGDLLLELLVLILGQRPRQQLGAPLHQFPHHALHLPPLVLLVGLQR